MKFWLLTFLIIFSTPDLPLVSNPDYYSSPVKIPILLSGNFGELRSNHFHSGIDIKTEGKTGLPVYAAAEGNVSRINISSNGFGLALYIDHPNGTTTVYGHLENLRDDMARYAKSVQYMKESFSIDISVPQGMFHVKKGELVAYSGNSGSSGGPHLHFEVRTKDNQHPINPLLYNFKVQDAIAPQMQSVMLYPLSDDAHVSGKTYSQRVETVYYDGAYHLKGNPVLNVYGDLGFGLQTLDYLDGSWSKCGVYEITLSVDGKIVYSFKMDELDFDETRYLNSHIDYGHLAKYGRRLHKSWVEPGNHLSNYTTLSNQGKVRLDDGKTHTINYLIKDVKGNDSKLEFKVSSKQMAVSKSKKTGIPIRYNSTNNIEKKGMKASFKTGTFYSDFSLEYEEKPANTGLYSSIYKLHNKEVPAHQYFDLKLEASKLPIHLREKALIALVDERTGKTSALGGNYEDGWVDAKIRQLGSFAIAIDTIAPTITPINIKSKITLTNNSKVSFKIRDDFSGIASYQGKIDGHWVLFEYDAKNNLLEYYFDKEHLELNKKHQLILVVTDAKNNQSTYEANFYR